MGTAIFRFALRANLPSVTSQIWRKGLGKSASGSRPRPGRMAVQPKGAPGFISRISTTRVSPGRAPSTRTGPVSGWPRNGPRPMTSSCVEVSL